MKLYFAATVSIGLFAASIAMAQQQPVDADALVLQHNIARDGVVPPAGPPIPHLTWDGDLANSAAAFAAQCTWGHSGDPGVGENIYYYSSSTLVSPEEVVTYWDSEKQWYDLDDNSCEPGRVCGHYTQVVWADTTFVGCGVAICDPKINGDWGQKWVCQYQPPGNIIGERPYPAGDDREKVVELDLFCDHVHKWGSEFTLGPIMADGFANTCSRPPLGSNVPGTLLTAGVFCSHWHTFGGYETSTEYNSESVDYCNTVTSPDDPVKAGIFCEHLHVYRNSNTSWPYSNDAPDAYEPPWIDLWSEEGFCYGID